MTRRKATVTANYIVDFEDDGRDLIDQAFEAAEGTAPAGAEIVFVQVIPEDHS